MQKQRESIRRSKEKEKEREAKRRESNRRSDSEGKSSGEERSPGRRRRRIRDRESSAPKVEELKRAPSAFFPESTRGDRKGKGLGVAFSEDFEAKRGDGQGGDSAESDYDTPRSKSGPRSPLETQEILLFYSVSLLHTMALDSAKVRCPL
jgi:hypothetical protein